MGEKRGKDMYCIRQVDDAKPGRKRMAAMTMTKTTKTIGEKTIGRCQTSCQIVRMIDDV